MNLTRKMFILAVEEMNFTKAARRAHVTQQCLSLHIRKLEEYYQTRLFERKPKLSLTLAGESLYSSLCRLEIIETSISERITDIKEEKSGEIIFGINATRARILIPDVIAEYQAKFPLVKVSLILDDMCNLVPMIINGNLDMFLGVDCVSNQNLKITHIAEDEVFLVAKVNVLEKYARSNYALTEALRTSTINLKNFKDIPIAGNNIGSSFTNLINHYLDSQNINQNIIFSVSDYELQIKICSQNDVISFCPKSVLGIVFEENKLHPPERELKIFRLHQMESHLRLDLVMHREMHLSRFKREFIKIFKNSILNNMQMIDHMVDTDENNRKTTIS